MCFLESPTAEAVPFVILELSWSEMATTPTVLSKISILEFSVLVDPELLTTQ